MNLREIQSVINIFKASERIVSENVKKIYIEFMLIRFHSENNYTDKHYANQWANRFSFKPTDFMDDLSLKVYSNLKKEV